MTKSLKTGGKEKVLKANKGGETYKIKRHENDSKFFVRSSTRGKTAEQYVSGTEGWKLST